MTPAGAVLVKNLRSATALMLETIFKIFSRGRYSAVAIFAGFLFLSFATLFWNFGLARWVINSSLSFGGKIIFLANLYKNTATFWTLTIAILFSMNIAVLTYSIKEKNALSGRNRVLAFLGISSGILGVSCSLCGFFIGTSLLSLIGAGSAIVFLPFGGKEFIVLSVFLLLMSSYFLLKNIARCDCNKITDNL